MLSEVLGTQSLFSWILTIFRKAMEDFKQSRPLYSGFNEKNEMEDTSKAAAIKIHMRVERSKLIQKRFRGAKVFSMLTQK